jgi:hypothetical protein
LRTAPRPAWWRCHLSHSKGAGLVCDTGYRSCTCT